MSGHDSRRSPVESGDSPSSATFSESTLRLSDSLSSFRPAPVNLGTPARKVIIRSDPSLVTCFDPADRELYDLWAPKKCGP